jgi:hypothetical protein
VVERAGTTAAQWYLVSPSEHYAAFFDSNGVPVWWMHSKHVAFNPTLLRGGVVAWYDLPKAKWFKFGVIPDGHYAVHRLDGILVRKLRAVDVPTDLHEIQQLPNGHLLLDAYRARKGVDLSRFHGPKKATVFYGEAQEITRKGRLVWRWSSRGHVALSETARWWPGLVATQRKFPKESRLYDVFHINSISPDGDGYVISGRHVDAVYRVDKATGRVDWKLGGTRTDRSLKIVADPNYGSTTFGGQHDARILPDGTLTVFDNGAERDRKPRLVRYRIDAEQRTATLIEQLTDPVITKASWGGGTRRLPGGDWVTGWGGAQYVTESKPSGESAFRLNFPVGNTYRAYPVLPGVLTAARLRAAMNRMHPRR